MKHRLLCFLMLLSLLPAATWAQTFVNLTPRPKTMTVGKGTLALPAQFSISYTGLDADAVNEVNQFATEYNAVTGAQVSVTSGDASALFQVSLLPNSSTLKDEGYQLKVTDSKVTIQAKTALGFFYAFQSVKKMLPANVMAGVKDVNVTAYPLPIVSITDEPRFEYRGFMLDVSRHFFTVNEVKRMLDVMAYYKMNKFHWHLTDDQGWRIEIKKYPKLTTVASIAPNSLFTDLYEAKQYWINKPYGPYFYTQDEIKDVVAYAKARHIDIIPEVDMPGHSAATMAAYPEYSCNPSGGHSVWVTGGISTDVMNVANPATLQFVKDVLDEVMELFPSKQIHIGGDECPTSAWQNNAECQALYKKLGLTNYRQLQSHFIKELDEYVREKGRKLSVWNESITAEGADLSIMKATDADVYCWYPAEQSAAKAAEIGMNSIYTPWGPYYINRKQGNSEQDPPNAGDGSDHVQNTYNRNIPATINLGIQGTFWCENVSNADLMEWSALPRLIAIAERGWTPESGKDFSDFQKRMSADTVMLNYNHYKYCKYYMLNGDDGSNTKVMPFVNTDSKKYYYRIISGGTDATRSGRCIELLADGSSLISQYSSNGAAVGRLWTNAQAAEGDANYDNQWWSLEQDPTNPGKYALVCKAQPNGSVNATPTATAVTGRWTYDNNAKHYNFVLGEAAYGKKGDNYYYTINSDQVSGQYFNSSMARQGLAVNVYNNPNDGNGGCWEFAPKENYGGSATEPIKFDYLQEGKTYTLTNNVDGFEKTALTDANQTTALTHSTSAYANNAWTVEASTINADGSQSVKMKNVATGRYITTIGSFVARQGCPVSVGAAPAEANVTLTYVPTYKDIRIKVGGKSVFALPSGNVNAGPTTSADATYDAPRVQGSEWIATEVRVITLNCVDEQGNTLGTYTCSVPASISDADLSADKLPLLTFKNFAYVNLAAAEVANTFNVTYKRSAYSITLKCADNKGVLISQEEQQVPVGESYKVQLPTPKYFTLESSEVTDGQTIIPEADATYNVTYTTDAIMGVKADGNVVTTLEVGKSYLIYDATDAAGRAGYRAIKEGNAINRYTTAEGMGPNAVWTLVRTATNTYKVKNDYLSLYVPQLQRSQSTTAAKTGAPFVFTLNADGQTFNVKGSNGMYWDGIENGALVGWDGGTGHPIRVSTFYGQPMYTVTIKCVDVNGKVLKSTTDLIAAGEAYTISTPTIDGYTLQSISGNEGYAGTVESYLNITATYKSSVMDGINEVNVDNHKQGSIYDLQGRRLQRVQQQGVYIINGQKVLVK